MAHYSALFTLGLLSERSSPTSSRSPSPTSNLFSKFRKISLPNPSMSPTSGSFSIAVEIAEHAPSPVEFSNPFFGGQNPWQETMDGFRSFLSLDLAESQSSLSLKLERNAISPLDVMVFPMPPVSARSASPMSTATVTPSPLLRSPPSSPLPSSRRLSRDSLRNLPSPKPAPSSTLPEIPSSHWEDNTLRSASALTPLTLPFPMMLSPLGSPASSLRSAGRVHISHRPSRSDPSDISTVAVPSSSAISSPSTSPPSRRQSYHSFSSTGTSVRTSRKRSANRNDALAALEGRIPGRRTPTPRARNFMSMSDDEDEEDGAQAVAAKDSTYTRRTRGRSTQAAAPPPTPLVFSSFDDEVEDRVLPALHLAIPNAIAPSRSLPPSRSSLSSLCPSPSKTRRRRSTMESWFPLANFIDFKDDDLAGWRGLVEIASAV